jgi:hypothetical protein
LLDRSTLARTGRLLAAALALLAGPSCSRQRSKQLAPAASVRETVALDASTAAPEVLPPQYRVFHVFPKETNIWSAGERLVACESRCIFDWIKGPVPRTWLVSATGVELDSSLLPQVKHIDRPVIRYWGTYPHDLYALIEVDHDSSDQRDLAFRYLGRRPAKHFVSSFPPSGSSTTAFVPQAFAPPEPKCDEHRDHFETFDAEERAAWEKEHGPDVAGPPRTGVRLCGYGGPSLVIDGRRLALWNGQSWDRAAAPWRTVDSLGALRLSNGATLVRSIDNREDDSRSLFWISPTGSVKRLDLQGAAAEPPLGTLRFQAPIEWNREIWLIAETGAGTALLAPIAPSQVTRPDGQGPP